MTIIRILISILMLAALGPAAVHAQETPPQVKIEKRQLLVPPKGEKAEPTAFLDSPAQWLREMQQNFYRSMSGSLRQIGGEGGGFAAWTLMLLSFGYGVFHAAGPGHGKAVISAWMLATESELKRGVLISFMSSLVQALAAIAVVSAVLFVFAGAVAATRSAASVLESASFALIGLLGLYLIWTAFRPVAHAHGHAHNHDHHHDHDHAHCGHAHVPEANQMRENWSLAKAISMSFAIGIRPCTGAILVLLAAYPMGLYWAGVISVFAMALGTFLTVSLIAAATVYAKQAAVRFAAPGRSAMSWLNFSLRLAAGLLVTGLGGMLFWASLSPGIAGG